MDAAPADPASSGLRSNRVEHALASGSEAREHGWGFWRITVWVLVIGWSAALIVTGVIGMYAKGFL